MKKLLIIISLVFVMLFSSACGTIFDNTNNNSLIKTSYTPAFDLIERSEDEQVLSGSLIYQKVAPCVVSVLNYKNSSDLQYTSEGSGVIMSEDGFIITNAHVIEGAEIIKIVLNNENDDVFTATKENFWYDTYTDLGVVKINTTGLPVAEFGDADDILIGEDIYAIGNPGGMQFKASITGGIVSYKYRPYEAVANSGYTINSIQVDAPINPGNSGGALVNMFGQVIGINSAKIADVNFEGMGFAISINDALPVVSELITKHYVSGRPAIGITYQLLTGYRVYAGNKWVTLTGAMIVSIRTESDMLAKGLAEKDVITHIDNIALTSSSQITTALKGKKAGDTITIKYLKFSENYAASKTADIILIEAK